MAQLESIQFEVGLTTNKDVLKQLKINKMWRRDEKGDFLSIQFDAQEFKFRPGVTFIVGKTVGNALIRSSAVTVGTDPLTDPILPYVIKIAETALGQAAPPKPSQFACPICGVDQKTGPRLARHLMDKKAHKEIEPGDEALEQVEKEGDASDGAESVEEGEDENA